MVKNIILSRSLDEKLDDLTMRGNELIGVLLYRAKRDRYLVESFLLTGIRTKGIAYPFHGMAEVAEIFLKKYANYGYIEFHTHIKSILQAGAIQSLNDLDSLLIDGLVLRRSDYLYLLVTPSKKILTGQDNPHLIVETLAYFDEKSKVLNSVLKMISNEHDYEFEKFQNLRMQVQKEFINDGFYLGQT